MEYESKPKPEMLPKRQWVQLQKGMHIRIHFGWDYFCDRSQDFLAVIQKVLTGSEQIYYVRDDGIPASNGSGENNDWHSCHMAHIQSIIWDKPYMCQPPQYINIFRTMYLQMAEQDRTRDSAKEGKYQYRRIEDEEAWFGSSSLPYYLGWKQGGRYSGLFSDLLHYALSKLKDCRAYPRESFAVITARQMWINAGRPGLTHDPEHPYTITVKWKVFLKWVKRNQSRLVYNKKQLKEIEKHNEEQDEKYALEEWERDNVDSEEDNVEYEEETGDENWHELENQRSLMTTFDNE